MIFAEISRLLVSYNMKSSYLKFIIFFNCPILESHRHLSDNVHVSKTQGEG